MSQALSKQTSLFGYATPNSEELILQMLLKLKFIHGSIVPYLSLKFFINEYLRVDLKAFAGNCC